MQGGRGAGLSLRAGFANMRPFGPWDICRPNDMRNYALIIIALLLIQHSNFSETFQCNKGKVTADKISLLYYFIFFLLSHK